MPVLMILALYHVRDLYDSDEGGRLFGEVREDRCCVWGLAQGR
jgi:hypothetical protein